MSRRRIRLKNEASHNAGWKSSALASHPRSLPSGARLGNSRACGSQPAGYSVKYVPYYPDPVDGQAILDNVTRTRRALKYRDNDRIAETINRGISLYDMELRERVGGNAGGNPIICRECVSACAYLKEQGIKVDLVYIDPPFASGADYAKKITSTAIHMQ